MILSRNFRSRLAFVLNNNDHPVKLRSLTPGRGALWVIRRDAEALIMVCIVVWSCIQGGYRWPSVRVSWPPSYTSPVATPYPAVIHRGSTPPDECTRIIQYQVGDEEIAAFVTSWRRVTCTDACCYEATAVWYDEEGVDFRCDGRSVNTTFLLGPMVQGQNRESFTAHTQFTVDSDLALAEVQVHCLHIPAWSSVEEGYSWCVGADSYILLDDEWDEVCGSVMHEYHVIHYGSDRR
jgi:hypothetical protein